MRRRRHDLLAWRQGIQLVKVIYRFAESFPKTEIYALTSQMRRAAVSVPANIAEGTGRNSTKEASHVHQDERRLIAGRLAKGALMAWEAR